MPSENDSDPLLSLQETADYLKLSASSVYKMLASDNPIPGVKVGKHWRFRMSAIDGWVAAQGDGKGRSTVRQPGTATARSFVPSAGAGMLGAPFTAEQVRNLAAIRITTTSQFAAIAGTPDGRTALARLLGIPAEMIDTFVTYFAPR